MKLLPNFTRQHLITHTNFPINDVGGRENTSKNFCPQSWVQSLSVYLWQNSPSNKRLRRCESSVLPMLGTIWILSPLLTIHFDIGLVDNDLDGNKRAKSPAVLE